MSWPSSIFIGFISSLVGAFGAGGWASCYADWYHLPNREGGRTYFTFFVGLLGLAVGLVVGLITARMVAGGAAPTFLRGLGFSVAIGFGVAALATLVSWLGADFPATRHGNSLVLHAELRCPASFELPVEAKLDEWYAHIDTRARRLTSYGTLRLKEAKRSEGRWMIPMTLKVDTRRREKLLYARLGAATQLFVAAFPAKPGEEYFEWSAWMKGSWETGQPRPADGAMYQLRFRLEEVVPLPAEPAVSAPTERENKSKALAESAAI